MNKINSHEVINHVQKLPALSTVVSELLTTMDQEDVDIDAIAKKIACDQVLTVKILRLANSSFYGMQHKVSSINEAITVLGFRNVRMMIASSAITGSFQVTKSPYFNSLSFWRHSIGTAVCAKELATHTGSNQEFAFIAGLIHDIGKLVLVTHYTKQYEKTLEYLHQHNCDTLTAEQAIMGCDHAEISRVVMQYWKFPEEMQIAISKQHLDDGEPANQLSGIIHLADIFSLALDFSKDDYAVVPKISPRVWENMHLDEQACRKICFHSERKFEAISQILIA